MPRQRDYALVTGTYWVFTLTDGALRMLVLLYLHQAGRSPFEIASLFLFYEFFGIVTNLFGGWLGARTGLKSTLVVGVSLQIAACGLLALNAEALTLTLFMLAQAMSGTAKDLTKMSSKSYVKLVVPEGDAHGLLRWVAWLTGSKNTLKGVGFFLGGWLLASIGFQQALWSMALALALPLVISLAWLPRAAGRIPGKLRLGQLIARDARVNWLSAARFFLFGARDIWFVLALPIFLSSSLGWSHSQVGGFLALWVIGYGVVQALAPSFMGRGRAAAARTPPAAKALALWTLGLLVPLVGILAGLTLHLSATTVLVSGLVAFGFVFASASTIHSYLIVAYSDEQKVSLNVGFYYMANAAGRLSGTLLSGSLFQAAGQGLEGLRACLVGSLVLVLCSLVFCWPLGLAERRARPQA